MAAAAAAEEAARVEADAMESDLQAEAEKLRQAAGDSEARRQQAEKAECVLTCCCCSHILVAWAHIKRPQGGRSFLSHLYSVVVHTSVVGRESLHVWVLCASLRSVCRPCSPACAAAVWLPVSGALPCPARQLLPLFNCLAACEVSSLPWLQGGCSLQGACH